MRLPKTLKRLLIPSHANNHKARLRHPNGFVWMSVLALFIPLLIDFAPQRGSVLGYATAISVESVLQLTNEQRAKHGLNPLKVDSQLTMAATNKANDMFAHNYWAHISPTGVQPWAFFNSAGYNYAYAGENLARDFNDSAGVVNAWMESPSHKENILNSKYEDIGFAVVNGVLDGVETTLVVQEFGTRRSATQVAKINVEPTKALIRTPTLVPTTAVILQVSPSPVPTTYEEAKAIGNVNGEIVVNTDSNRTFLSPLDLAKSWTLAIGGLLVLVFMIDLVVISKVKLPRIGGKTWAHLMVILFVISAILYTDSGIIK